jgi:hypothetical protein
MQVSIKVMGESHPLFHPLFPLCKKKVWKFFIKSQYEKKCETQQFNAQGSRVVIVVVSGGGVVVKFYVYVAASGGGAHAKGKTG